MLCIKLRDCDVILTSISGEQDRCSTVTPELGRRA
jgi:hypothetical protein